MKLILYKTTDPRNKLNNSNLTDNYNYAYIEVFDRYYFINSITKLNFSLSELEFETDLLSTYKDIVLASTGLVSHAIQEGDYRLTNPKTSDNYEMELFNSDVELTNDNTILLTTISGLET